MKKIHIIFFSVYGVFHLGLVGMTFYVNNLFAENKLTDLLSMAKQVPTLRWLALGGLVIFGLNVLLFVIMQQKYESKLEELENEKNRFKAQMFDMQQSGTTQSTGINPEPKEPENPEEPEEPTSPQES